MSVVANVAINVDSRNAVSKLREVQSQSQQTERAIGDLGGAIGKLAAAFSLIQAAKFVFVNAAEIETQTRSLQVLTGSAEKAGQIIKDLQQLGAVTPFTSSELIDSAKRLQAFGIETNKVVETTRRLADVSGATGAELQGLVTAYGQVQAKGRLQGEELLQFQERGVALQQVLREEYGLSGEEFQKALEKGRISAEAVEFAIQKLTDAGGKYANGAIAQSDTLNGRLSTLQDSIQVLAQTIGRTLAPVFQWALTQATAVVSEIQRILDEANNAGGARDREAQFARNADAAVRAMRLNPFTQQGMMADMRQRNIEQQRADYRLRQQQARTPSAPSITTMPPLLGAAAGGGKGRGGKSDAEKAAEKAAREAEKLRQELERSLEVGDQLGTQFSRQATLLFEGSEIERKRLQIQFDFQDRAKQIAELKNAEQRTNLNQLNAEIQRLEIIQLQTEELKKQAEEADKLFKAAFEATEFGVSGGGPIASMLADMEQGLRDFLAPANQVKTAATAIGDAFSASFKAVITGTKSAQEAIIDFFNKIGDALIDYATQAIAQYIAIGIARLFAGLDPLGSANQNLSGTGALSGGKLFPTGAFAEGGFVTGPTNALIGEGGEPEYVIPASKMRAAMGRYAGGARGAAVIPGNGESGGGYGGGAGGGAIDVRYSIERINNVDYVTAEQFQRGMAEAAQQGAQQGETRALRRLQMSSSTRRKVGV